MKETEKLFKTYVKAMAQKNEKELDYIIAKNDAEQAYKAYKEACAEEEQLKQDFIDNVKALETVEEKIMYVLDNKDYLLELFFCKKDILDYQNREIDRKLKEVNTNAG